MKIVCDSCGAKYSIADEKVAGKVFKIRCKKCSAVIVVRGDQVAAEQEESTQVYDYGGDAIWHVVIDGEQKGPFAPAQIGEMLSAGTVDWEVYVWREGFDGWLAARDVPELVEAVMGGSGADAGAAQGAGRTPSDEPPTQIASAAATADMGADPFGGQAAGSPFAAGGADGMFGGGEAFGGGGGGDDAHGAIASRAARDAGADLFAQSGPSPFEAPAADEEDVVASGGGSPRVSADQASMTGARNENSVLFSLTNLQALATGGNESATPLRAAPAPSNRPGQASGEGSGLIDIRALASTAMGPAGSGQRAGVDDLMSIGAGAAGFGGTALAAPVLAPVKEERSNRGLIVGIVAAAGVLAAAAVAIVVILVTQSPDSVEASGAPAGGAIQPAEATQGTAAAAPGSPEGTAADGTGTVVAAAPAASAAQEEPGADSDRGSSGSRRAGSSGSRRASSSGRSSSGSSSAPAAAAAEAPSAAASPRRGGNDIDSLLEAALSGNGSGGARARPSGGSSGASESLPDTPPRDAVGTTLRSVEGAVQRCGEGQHGVAMTAVTISGATGRVTSANVSGQFAGTPIGSCVARAVRGARFPRFSRPTFQVSFPYRL